jgi:hypothetical protein
MRWLSSLAAVAFWTALTAAQSLLKGLPDCAKDCVGNNFGGCSLLDVPCICANKDLINNLSCCVANTCSAADQAAVIKFAKDLCVANGVSVPTQASCAASASPTGSSASSSAASSGSPSSGSSSATPTAAANSATASAAQSGAAAVPTMGSGLGLGVAMAGLLAAL